MPFSSSMASKVEKLQLAHAASVDHMPCASLPVATWEVTVDGNVQLACLLGMSICYNHLNPLEQFLPQNHGKYRTEQPLVCPGLLAW